MLCSTLAEQLVSGNKTTTSSQLFMKPKIQLVTRADDAGSCRSANEAILECVEAGLIKNVSFMAVGPEIEHAARLLGGRDDIAFGLHVCLNAEWQTVKWGPLTKAPVLVDENGHFWPFPPQTKLQIQVDVSFDARDFTAIVGGEINAQLGRLRDLGLNICYVDEHMSVSWISPSVRGFIENLCRLHGLVDAHFIPFLPGDPEESDEDDDFQVIETRFKRATGDKYVWVTHPGKVAPDMNAFHIGGQAPGVVAHERNAERLLLLDSRLPQLFEKWRVQLARYDELK